MYIFIICIRKGPTIKLLVVVVGEWGGVRYVIFIGFFHREQTSEYVFYGYEKSEIFLQILTKFLVDNCQVRS